MTKSVFVTLAGHTNAGKSSLLNAIIGEKIASVSPKPQTTRTRITGIKTVGETQMVFMGFKGEEAGYFIIFSVCAFSHLLGWVVMKALVPKYKPITDL